MVGASGTAVAPTKTAHPTEPVGLPKSKRRPDIQGLRALLMIQVLLFHAWFIGSPIGVDAFIMISAYLMTASFIRRSEAGVTPSVLDRWATTFKRLLPPLAIVVVLTLFASLLVLPPTRWRGMVSQSYASLTYWQNWLLGWISTDYFAENHALSSPLQHLWSMSMQGQMFLLWPVIMALLVSLARRANLSIRKTIFVGFSLIAALSLAWLLTTSAPLDTIYFDSRARIWEFALGSAIAAIAPKLQLPAVLRNLLAGVALVVIIVFSLVLIGVYPGPMAAAPMLAASALLVTGGEGQPTLASRLLSWDPLVRLGDISYAVYLIHWPLFVLYLVVAGKENLRFTDGIVLMAISVVLAYWLTKYVDDPIRTSVWANTPKRKAKIIGLTLWLSLTAVLTVQIGVARTAEFDSSHIAEVAEAAESALPPPTSPLAPPSANPVFDVDSEPEPVLLEGYPGAAAMLHKGKFSFAPEAAPGPLSLDEEWVQYDGACSDEAGALLYQYEGTGCHAHGDPDSAAGRILIAGSSHAEQVLMPAARIFADQNNYYVEASLKAGCPWSMPDPETPADCGAHNANVLRYAQENPFDYVFFIVTATRADSPEESLGYGAETLIRELTKTGATVVGIRDNLRSTTDLYECAASQAADAAYGGCLLNRADYFGSDSLVDPLLSLPGFHYVEVMDLYCDGEVCPTIAGNTHIYLDTNHVTQSYGNTMAPIILERFADALTVVK